MSELVHGSNHKKRCAFYFSALFASLRSLREKKDLARKTTLQEKPPHGNTMLENKQPDNKKMKNKISFLLCLLLSFTLKGQDTFSIVAVDPATGEVGSAGASCISAGQFGLPPDFLGVLFPNVGAINTQAYYIPANQTNASARMEAGDSPQEIIDWLVANDIQNNPTLRQYGVVRIVNGEGLSAAHTGNNTDDWKGHLTGPNYSIQGNILLDESILLNMENNFLNTTGTLADKLMAALQGANVVGADTRCINNGTSSLFAFLKVAQPNDPANSPSLVLGVDSNFGAGFEPIDSIQSLFDALFPSSEKSLLYPALNVQVFPQPAGEEVHFALSNLPTTTLFSLTLFDNTGKQCYQETVSEGVTKIARASLPSQSQLYWFQLRDEKGEPVRAGKLLFQ
jgi:uncharacterized Ntn-hydrolase superfamily protein